ncbi:hypothetical protein QE152_g7478 [Popillia japonica]|uniref:Uncharacterized protein n=1 Tax=Popillia japonica TaxID=7064 RepID=A0AAW1MER7_POPJA
MGIRGAKASRVGVIPIFVGGRMIMMKIVKILNEIKQKSTIMMYAKEEPLSPETQKKNELCSYLQLMNMNCTDRKLASKIQNRRSTRVKNLIIMSEKKELERRLNNQNRRSTRVKNLIIMSEKKELERRLNNEAKRKENETNGEEKKWFGGSDIDMKEIDEREFQLSDYSLKKKETAVRISERRRSLSLKSLENVNLDLRKNSNTLTPKSRRVLLERRHSLNTEVKRKDLVAKYFESGARKENNFKLFGDTALTLKLNAKI